MAVPWSSNKFSWLALRSCVALELVAQGWIGIHCVMTMQQSMGLPKRFEVGPAA